MPAVIAAIASALPEGLLANADLGRLHPDWEVDKVAERTGITERRVSAPGETASDLAVRAAERLFAAGAARREEVDFLLFCTQCPDHFLPTTACLVQHRLGLPTSAGAIDYNLGCSGYVYGLALARALVESGQARCLLLLTADTYTHYLAEDDRSTRTLFGDGAAATLIRAEGPGGVVGATVQGSDGSGGPKLIVPGGAQRLPGEKPVMHMDGPEIFAFSLKRVPGALRSLLERGGVAQDQVDWFVFHQANGQMLEHLRRKLGIPAERFPIAMGKVGNTGSATIPLVLEQLLATGSLKAGQRAVMLGFGVGFSWGGVLAEWR